MNTKANRKRILHKNKQSGAALVVGLILLVAMTLLALASMNTASLDLVMAGNEQYRGRAFAAAEAGIEQVMPLNSVNDAMFDTGGSHSSAGSTATGEAYSYVVSPTDNKAYDMPGNSIGLYKARFFTIVSTATTTRSTSAEHTQEVATVILDPGGPSGPTGSPGGSSSSASGGGVALANCLAATAASC